MEKKALATLCLVVAACHGSSTDSSPAPAASSARALPPPPPASSAPLPPPFTGTLTVELVQSAKGSLPAPKPLREALGELEAKLGPPTHTRQAVTIGPKRTWYEWAATNGTTCATYGAVEQPNMLPSYPSKLVDDHATSVTMPAHVIDDPEAKGAMISVYAAWRDYAECLGVLGQKLPFPPGDPKAKGPSGPITHASLQHGLYTSPSLWIGKSVTVRGSFEGVSGGTKLMIKATGDADKDTILACRVPAHEVPPEPKKSSEPITVSAVVADPRDASEDSAELVDCRVTSR